MGKRAAVADKAQADKANEKSKEVTCDVPDWLKKLQAFAESCSLQSESTEVAAAEIGLKVANETMAGAEVVTSIKKLPFFLTAVPGVFPAEEKTHISKRHFFLEPAIEDIRQPDPTVTRVSVLWKPVSNLHQTVVWEPAGGDTLRFSLWLAIQELTETGIDSPRLESLKHIASNWKFTLVRDQGAWHSLFREYQSLETVDVKKNIEALTPLGRGQRFEAVQRLLKDDNKPYGAAEVGKAFKDQRLRYASKESEKAAVDGTCIQKHLTIVRRCKEAQVVDIVENLTVVQGEPTALMRWKVLEQLGVKAKTPKQYRAIVLQLWSLWVGPEESRPKNQISVHDGNDAFALWAEVCSFVEQLVDKVLADFRPPNTDPMYEASIQFLDKFETWESYQAAFLSPDCDKTQFGLVPEKVQLVGTFLQELRDGAWHATLVSMVRRRKHAQEVRARTPIFATSGLARPHSGRTGRHLNKYSSGSFTCFVRCVVA